MKADIHPKYVTTHVTCACGNEFDTHSTMGDSLSIDICSACHPFYTGNHKVVDTTGQVERFEDRFGDITSMFGDSSKDDSAN